MNPPRTVCILTAGKGTRMGNYGQGTNKALLPLQHKAVISHIVDSFPADTEFVIGLGYLADQVRNYLTMAHPLTKFHFAAVDRFEGPGSGPGYSLLCCESLLKKPFYFVSCDTLWNRPLDFTQEQDNWLGVAEVKPEVSQTYCNFEIQDGVVINVKDKEHAVAPRYKAFVGLCFIKDYALFFDALKTKNLIAQEHQVSNGIRALIDQKQPRAVDIDWIDVGNAEQYRNAVLRYQDFDFSKTGEFLYMLNNKVIKFFNDESITQKRVAKAKLKPAAFPNITATQGQFYAYPFLEGNTLYQQNSPQLFQKFLDWISDTVWTPHAVDKETVSKTCRTFYFDKTNERLELYLKKLAVADKESVVNGVRVPSARDLLQQIDWKNICDGIPVFMHGDLQFDNILYCPRDKRFVLLDWRQDFGGNIAWGDLYYDLAKLYGGIILNYDYIKANLLSYTKEGHEVTIDFAQRFLTNEFLRILTDFLRNHQYNVAKVRILVGIIYLNMAPLHHAPFDQLLYALGRLTLKRALDEYQH